MNKRTAGDKNEQLACDFLEQNGLRVLARNYRKRIGEIDIIARDGEYFVFIEVKYRAGTMQGGAAYAISGKKKAIIRRVAQWYMAEHRIPQDALCRFDAVLIDGNIIRHVRNAW